MAENPAGKRAVFYHQAIMPWPVVALWKILADASFSSGGILPPLRESPPKPGDVRRSIEKGVTQWKH
jgi:hypothetical protein